MRTNVRALNRIGTHGLSIQAIKAYAADRAATVTGPRNIKRLQVLTAVNM
jgi:hypothetical protein